MNPFVYPKSAHERRERPEAFASYQRYKPVLKREFRGKCVYCRMPDSLKGEEAFGVDHYRPKSKFPRLGTSYENLFYCCNPCNSRKGDHWHAKSDRRIPDPCKEAMFKHARFTGPSVDVKTASGAMLRDLLDLNDPAVVRYRATIISLIHTAVRQRDECERTYRELAEKRAAGAVAEPLADAGLAELVKEIEQQSDNLRILCGA